MTGAEALGVGLASRALLIVVDLLMTALALLVSRLWQADRTSVVR